MSGEWPLVEYVQDLGWGGVGGGLMGFVLVVVHFLVKNMRCGDVKLLALASAVVSTHHHN